MHKAIISSLLCSTVLFSATGYSCATGEFGIAFVNNTNETSTPHQISVQVQDAKTSKDLTEVKSPDPTGSGSATGTAELCFSESYSSYKLWQYPGKDANLPNTVYTIDKSTLVDAGYYMTIYATDSNFKPETANKAAKKAAAAAARQSGIAAPERVLTL